VALKDRRLRRRIDDLVSSDRRFRVGVMGRGRFCPWCGELALPEAEGDALVEAVLEHIEACGAARGDPGAPMMTEVGLHEIGRFFILREKIQSEPACRIFGPDGRWLCPYCAEFQEMRAVGPDGRRLEIDQVVHGVARHFDRCFQYQENPERHHTVQELRAYIQKLGRQRKFREEISNLMKTNPVMQFRDKADRWVCPFCRQPVEYVDMSTPLLREHSAPMQAAKHLSSECPAAKESVTLTITANEMRTVVDRINREKGLVVAKEEAVPAGSPDDTGRLKALRAEVMALRDEVKHDKELAKSMERARAVQQKMLPDKLPAVPGYELSREFRECETVSGDFYDTMVLFWVLVWFVIV
jgi:hypothetical protein